MRLGNACDEMNLTGCMELHNWEATGRGINHFLYVYQIESAFIFAFILIGLTIYFTLRKIRKSGGKGR